MRITAEYTARGVFYWTGDDESSEEPAWTLAASEAGIVEIEREGMPKVCLMIHGRRFPRGSLMTRRDLGR